MTYTMTYKKTKIPDNFLGLEKPYSDWDRAKFVVLPVPYEYTTSYVKGTKKGPKAIIEASKHLERFDEEIGFKACKKAGIYTENTLKLNGLSEGAVQDLVGKSTGKILQTKKIPILLGGEHSISIASVKACKKIYNNLSVLQIDAHGDLRNSYKGTKYSHACVMRRILEICPAVQVGIRNISEEEYLFAKRTGQLKKIHFASKFNRASIKKILKQLSKDVYVTIDIDGLDPSIVPATGTPEPGGLGWYQVLDLLKAVAKEKKVVGFDLVELSPVKGLHAADFIAAKLTYKMIGYIVRQL